MYGISRGETLNYEEVSNSLAHFNGQVAVIVSFCCFVFILVGYAWMPVLQGTL